MIRAQVQGNVEDLLFSNFRASSSYRGRGFRGFDRRVQDWMRVLGSKVWGLTFGVWGLTFRVWGLEFRVQGLGSKVWGFRVSGVRV